MNKRGKQLEKHEILKARLLKNIKDESERTLYAHIWDICSQMDNYIFQKASDRVISKLNESSGNENTIECIIGNNQQKITKKDDDEDEFKFKSIVDFPTFLLHVYKLTYLKKASDVTIDKNKLLEIIKIEQKEIEQQKIEQKAKKFIINLLKYRILFDYFVIKSQDDVENSYKIRRLSKKYSTYTISEDSNVMPELAMVQNYLRVARSGMTNNHHHWLTPFLKFLDKEINLNFSFDGLNDDENKIQINNNINFDDFITKDKNVDQKNLISFLENLDTTLAKEQLQNNDLISKVNEILQDSQKKDDENFQIDNFFKKEKCILDKGTATPHYWFYRLEYYLWKYSKTEYNEKLKKIDWGNFSKIASNFYFRSLNSIEHVQAQSKANENGWNNVNIDNFGNLALISSSFNSSLNNQDVPSKYRDFQKRYMDNKKAVISLKLWLIYALANKDGEDKIAWIFGKAKEHKNQMLEVLKNSFESKQDKA
ncbi:DUF1524 domain-containing protein [Campylobacter sp. IFREMER_LSEM_CL2090]|uniref:GmrSD restriction endonuclease domain-containing protein n=1 Tax=Campylobacter sp. IFREMER_LSEM_CL2090 TaxID=2911617 RepID=UPI0021E7EEE8|nr:DUF1524 domain-containing protein [Campylobacter sp. IFREMER_LSEM_CL2090]MCV3402544.1 DUF1524 domain-containing protein [Campylobacter sp. IFREMER_LSEM_CL2090]